MGSKVNVYTDGACSGNPGPGGWAVLFCYGDHYEKLSGRTKRTTNNMMELQAVISALEEMLSLKAITRTMCSYEVISDSAYVVNAIVNGWVDKWRMNGWMTTSKQPVKNKELWCQYLDVARMCNVKGIQITYKKVKGHSNDKHNNMVDKLARHESLRAKEEL